VAVLLESLREADGQMAVLAAHAAAGAPLDDPDYVAWLLDRLRGAGAAESAAALAARAADVPLDNPRGVARLLGALREAGAGGQAATLAARLPGAGLFGLFLEQQGSQDRFQFGREADGSPSGSWSWDDLD